MTTTRYTVVTANDEESFDTLEAAVSEASKIATRSGRLVDVIDESTERTCFVAMPQ